MRFDTLAAWLKWQERLHPVGIDLTLERVRRVLDAMGLAPAPFRAVTVGGTNGKGSCVAVLEALARTSGLRTGAYTSPHLVRYNERVRVDGAEVDDALLLVAFDAVDRARGDITLTYFEFGTLAALEIFRRQAVELAVLEVGLGGRLDAVNTVEPEAAIVTSVGLDHVEWLGQDRERIGGEKAGIFRPGRPAVIGERDPPASLLAGAGGDASRIGVHFERGESGSTWWWRDPRMELHGLPRDGLRAPALLDNAACALAAFARISPPGVLDEALARRAIAGLQLRGRLQRVPGPVEWWLDVAHNADGAAVLAGALAAAPVRGRTIAVTGILGDKDVEAIAAAMSSQVDRWITVGLPPPRGLAAAALAARIGPVVRAAVDTASDVVSGCSDARTAASPGDRVVVFGSFHVVGPALEWLGVYSGAAVGR